MVIFPSASALAIMNVTMAGNVILMDSVYP